MSVDARRRAIVLRGGWDGHDPYRATDESLAFLEQAGFACVVTDDPEIYADPAAMASTDLVLQCVTMGTASKEAVRGLADAVAAGTGLVGWHGGIVDSFRDPRYLHLVGGQFVHHPPNGPAESRAGDGTDNFVDHRIEIVASDHPIVAGIADFDLRTEQYWVLTDGLNDVLATTTIAARSFDPWQNPVTCPAVWTRKWGDGRVVVVTPGHRLEDLRQAPVRTMIERGVTWAAR